MRAVRYILIATILGTLGVWFYSRHGLLTWEKDDRWVLVGWGAIRIYPQPLDSFLDLEFKGLWYYSGSPIGDRTFPKPGITLGHIVVPFWLLLAGMIPPCYFLERDALRERRRRRRIRMGACGFCGYDLMGNESGVCPECGRRAEEKV